MMDLTSKTPTWPHHYHPGHGGHAPGFLREAFCMLIDDEELDWDELGADDRRPPKGESDKDWICGQLWNCTDIMPGEFCRDLEIPPGSTYGQGARAVKYAP
jgi:hypothetical protein